MPNLRNACLFALIAVSCATFARAEPVKEVTISPASPEGALETVKVDVDMTKRRPISKTLYGIFFEEIMHGGDGGLYAEMINDHAFSGLSFWTGFRDLPISKAKLHLPSEGTADSHNASASQLWPSLKLFNDINQQNDPARLQSPRNGWDNDMNFPWRVVEGAGVWLERMKLPWQANGTVVRLATTGDSKSGLSNHGYDGIAMDSMKRYSLSISLFADDSTDSASVGRFSVTAAVKSSAGKILWSDNIERPTGLWITVNTTFSPIASDINAHFELLVGEPGNVYVSSISLFPSENILQGTTSNPWPFRLELQETLKQLQPRFLRFPGGCFVEGERMRNAFRWKKALGPAVTREGHYNDVWGYWSTDGLGLFEYMQLADLLKAEPVWVINSGVSHNESIPPSQIQEFVDDALNSIEFVRGEPDTPWGAERKNMGREEPWKLTYMAIGNEDCGKKHYTGNYLSIYSAIKTMYPDMQLISNCDMGDSAPQQLYDIHVYTSPEAMFAMRRAFDNLPPDSPSKVFVSEYAVTTGGGRGNMLGAAAEAGFMTGMERNSEAVAMASFAPLFQHAKMGATWPTNLIVFDNYRHYTIPSYHVQRLFREHQGVERAWSRVSSPDCRPLASLASLDAVTGTPKGRAVVTALRARLADVDAEADALVQDGSEGRTYVTQASPPSPAADDEENWLDKCLNATEWNRHKNRSIKSWQKFVRNLFGVKDDSPPGPAAPTPAPGPRRLRDTMYEDEPYFAGAYRGGDRQRLSYRDRRVGREREYDSRPSRRAYGSDDYERRARDYEEPQDYDEREDYDGRGEYADRRDTDRRDYRDLEDDRGLDRERQDDSYDDSWEDEEDFPRRRAGRSSRREYVYAQSLSLSARARQAGLAGPPVDEATEALTQTLMDDATMEELIQRTLEAVDESGLRCGSERVAASVTCQDDGCKELAVKLVNLAPHELEIQVRLAGLAGAIVGEGQLVRLNATEPQAENSFGAPNRVSPTEFDVFNLTSFFGYTAPGTSVSIFRLVVDPKSKPDISVDSLRTVAIQAAEAEA